MLFGVFDFDFFDFLIFRVDVVSILGLVLCWFRFLDNSDVQFRGFSIMLNLLVFGSMSFDFYFLIVRCFRVSSEPLIF